MPTGMKKSEVEEEKAEALQLIIETEVKLSRIHLNIACQKRHILNMYSVSSIFYPLKSQGGHISKEQLQFLSCIAHHEKYMVFTVVGF